MKKVPLIILLVFLGLCATAQAAVVYLKNGRVMTGKIVEKTEQYIILKAGEGENTVRTTIFIDDINRIESEEDYSQSSKFIPFELMKPGGVLEMPAPSGFQVSRNETESVVEKFLKENQRYEPGNFSPAQGFEGPGLRPFVPGTTEAKGAISGIVRLPDVIRKAKGDLYVYLMKDTGSGKFMAMTPILYQKIDASAIIQRQISYTIGNVTAGTYKVFAQWDTAPPPIEEKTVAGGATLRNLGVKGDYTGLSPEVILGAGEEKYNVNFDCGNYLTSNRMTFVPGERSSVEIQDLIYRRLSPTMENFILVVKNEADIPTSPASFDVWINDEKVGSGVVTVPVLEPHQEKEVDMTAAYEQFRKTWSLKHPRMFLPKVLKFKLSWLGREESEFEKTIFTLR